ncbi:unnamed protein product [Adineta ricciae]|uniref:HAT C-terminal dimerisation domain-containing protein n=1 Tax=Adineta ricciae TaxID=249248 RepID=A0A815ISS5_ADIRI|nr:unnamed protein product [Adineta ricciae]CAF1439756.1 unnamed protein product [Adineta ricciae]
MKQCTDDQRNSCLEYIKQEMIMFDAFDNDNEKQLENSNFSNTLKKRRGNERIQTGCIMEKYYDEEDEPIDSPITTTAMRQIEIGNYLKFGMDKQIESCSSVSSSNEEEYNSLNFWKHNFRLYPRLSKMAKRVFSVLATSTAVEREFSLAGNIVTKKRS